MGSWVVVDLGISNVVIITDVETVARCINQNLQVMEVRPVILDCLDLLTKGMNLAVSYMNRACNAAAYNLASLARRCGYRSWIGYRCTDVFSFYHVIPTFSGSFSTF